MRADQHCIVITGAARGIGLATARLFHSRGWFVGAYDVDREALHVLADELGAHGVTGELDVRDYEAFVQRLSDFGARTGDRLDVLFNNAGVTAAGYLDAVPIETVHRIVDINLTGVLNGVHAASSLLEGTPNSLCFTTASSAASFGTSGMATYSATKAAVKALTEALSVELARFDSRAADVSPGIIDTPLWHGMQYVRGRAPRKLYNVAAANVDRTDHARTLPAEAVAQCVWDAYHGDKVHWYVPAGIADRVRDAAHDPEQLRNEAIAQESSRAASHKTNSAADEA